LVSPVLRFSSVKMEASLTFTFHELTGRWR
jgi:hypothetical protein